MHVEGLIELAQAPDKTLGRVVWTPPERVTTVAVARRQSFAAVDAIRELACIGEDARDEGTPIPDGVQACLRGLLTSGVPALRAAAVEALWQMTDRESLPQLRAAWEQESIAETREIFAHVIRILEP